jgi:hypothetical protein
MRKNILALIGVLSLTVASSASAGFITGNLGYSDVADGTNWSYDMNLNTVTIAAGGVDSVTGDLALSINANDSIAAVSTFTYDVFVPSQTIWSLGGFTFNLDSITSYVEINANNLFLFGKGTLSGNGYEDTAYNWEFSGNSITFSAANVVPEPSVIALFGLGLLGMGLVGRRKKQA